MYTDVTIGFDPVMYFTHEAEGRVSLTVRVLSGRLAHSVDVMFSTVDESATSSALEDYGSSLFVLHFSSEDLIQQTFANIFDDEITENSEFFNALLISTDEDVILAPNIARVEIKDDGK